MSQSCTEVHMLVISFKYVLLFVAYCFTPYLTVCDTAYALLSIEGCALKIVDGVQVCPFSITMSP